LTEHARIAGRNSLFMVLEKRCVRREMQVEPVKLLNNERPADTRLLIRRYQCELHPSFEGLTAGNRQLR